MNKGLLFILFLLLAIRFVLLPVIAWQNDVLSGVEAKAKQVAKQQALIEALPAYAVKNAAMTDAIDEVSPTLFGVLDDVPLETQLILEKFARDAGAKVSRFEWLARTQDATPTGRFRVDVRGSLNQLAQWQLAVESAEKFVGLDKWSFRARRGRNVENAPYEGSYEGRVLMMPEYSPSLKKSSGQEGATQDAKL